MTRPETTSGNSFFFQNLPRKVLAPLPLPLLQPLLHRIIIRAARNRPELFTRLGPHRHKIFLIDPVNMPFVFFSRRTRRIPGSGPAAAHAMHHMTHALPEHF
jgi:hypothetical protein